MENLEIYWDKFNSSSCDLRDCQTNAIFDATIEGGYICENCRWWIPYGENHLCHKPETFIGDWVSYFPPENKTEKSL